jgi:hypothetical protein
MSSVVGKRAQAARNVGLMASAVPFNKRHQITHGCRHPFLSHAIDVEGIFTLQSDQKCYQMERAHTDFREVRFISNGGIASRSEWQL